MEGATPAIVPKALFGQVQSILADPARTQRLHPSFVYPLRGRLHCSACGAAMVGQALEKGRYHYYRCRQSYAGPRGKRCSSPYVRKERLEAAILSAFVEVLTNPARILSEVSRLHDGSPTVERRTVLDHEISDIEDRQRRLVRLYTAGDIPEGILQEESRVLSSRMAQLRVERDSLAVAGEPIEELGVLAARMPEAMEAIRRWVQNSDGDELDLLLRAFDVTITASRDALEIRGAMPLIHSSDYADLVTIERTSA